MVRDLYADLKRKHGETTAASAMRTLRAVVNTAMRIDETLGSNPVAALHVPSPKRRKVAPLDLAEWWAKVERLSPVRRDLHVAMLLTGARRSSLVQVRREDVDPARGVMTFTHMKTSDEPMLFPMGAGLAAIVAARLEEDGPLGSDWLWPSPTSRSGHVEEPKERGLPSRRSKIRGRSPGTRILRKTIRRISSTTTWQFATSASWTTPIFAKFSRG